MGSDNRRLALLGFHLNFATDDALAEAAGTRTWVQGSDYVQNVAHALATGPGRVNQTALQMFRDAQNPPAAQSSQSSTAQSSDNPKYDCATDTCSNGKQLSGIGKPFRRLACTFQSEETLAGLCRSPPAPGTVEGTDGGGDPNSINPFDPFARYKLPANAFKRVAFLLLALVLIYAGVRALS